MSRAAFLDAGIGETRGVVMLDGRPERLMIERDGEAACQRLGARSVGRVRRIDRGLGLAFVALPQGVDATAPAARLTEGQALEVEIAAESRSEKGAVVTIIGPAEGEPRLLKPGPDLTSRLTALAGSPPVTGDEARRVADEAEEAALAITHTLPGGGRITVEPTRAAVAVDVDIADRKGGDARQLAKQTNLVAIAETARLLRLKSLGGLVVIDLVGKGHDGTTLAGAAKAAFAPDGDSVSIGPISRFGLFELSLPHQGRPVADVLTDQGAPSLQTLALRLVRVLEREGRANPGARLTGRCAPDVARALDAYMQSLTARLGARVEIVPDPALGRAQFEVAAR